MNGYFQATRHPWSSVLFVVPLLLAYEIGLWHSGPAQQDQLRNGADSWLRLTLAQAGVSAIYAAPLLLLAVLLIWSFGSLRERSKDQVGVLAGMLLESGLFALGLFGLSKGMEPALRAFGVSLHMHSPLDPGSAQLLTYFGAGVYEEALFRLLIFSGLLWIFVQSEFPLTWSLHLATLGSAFLFAAAHHWGPFGEPYVAPVFLFRCLAGMYFAWLYYLRGFGIAVGAHTGYDVLVGIFVPGWHSGN